MSSSRYAYLAPHKVPEKGRELQQGDFSFFTSQLKEGEKLVGLYDRGGKFKNAPWLHSEEEYKGFEDRVQTGLIWSLGYFAVPDEIFEDLVVL